MKRHVEDIEEKMSEIVEEAYRNGKVPIECIQEYELNEEQIVRVVEFHET